MKNSLTLFIALHFLLLFSGCSSLDGRNPSQNEALNAVSSSGSHKSKPGSMQQVLDNWIEKEWTPTIERNETIKNVNEDDSRDFTLQEFVDKAVFYHREKNSTSKESHTQKINDLPVIGR